MIIMKPINKIIKNSILFDDLESIKRYIFYIEHSNRLYNYMKYAVSHNKSRILEYFIIETYEGFRNCGDIIKYASKYGKIDIIILLLNYSHLLYSTDINVAIDIANDNKHYKIVEYLTYIMKNKDSCIDKKEIKLEKKIKYI